MDKSFFHRLTWKTDRMLLDDLVFRLETCSNDDDWDLGDECFKFYKVKGLVDQFALFWLNLTKFHAKNVFEIGIFDGGSLAFWHEYFRPRKIVGIDISERGNSDYLERYKKSRNAEGRISTYWGVDQEDCEAIEGVIQKEFSDPLDVVIDDASHRYGSTKATFETIFPHLRPGGLYFIEDWAWEFWKESYEVNGPGYLWFHENSLAKLVIELVEVIGSSWLIESLTIYRGFAVIKRSALELSEKNDFKVENYIFRRPKTLGEPIEK